MNSIAKYIIIFLLFSVLGWLYEHYFLKVNNYDTVCKKLLNLNVPMFSIYGAGGVILFFIHDNFKNFGFLEKVILATLIINIMECVAGKLSLMINGYKTWNYDHYSYPLCDGYISLSTAVWWTILIAIIFKILDILKL